MRKPLPTDKVIYTGKDVLFFCPGCKQVHAISVQQWSFNNNLDKPSILHGASIAIGKRYGEFKEKCCHFFINRGVLYYCSDSSKHSLRDQIVEMVPYSDWFSTEQKINILGSNAHNTFSNGLYSGEMEK